MEHPLTLVTLAHITFNRIGSASRGGMARHSEIQYSGEVANEDPQTLREFVIGIAEKHGEIQGSLRNLTATKTWDRTHQNQVLEFNIHGPNTQYSYPYAICYAHPALKIGDRYFRLDEVRVSPSQSGT